MSDPLRPAVEDDRVHHARVFVEHFADTVRPHLRKPLHHRYSAMAAWPVHLVNGLVATAGAVVCVLLLALHGGVDDAHRTLLFLALASLAGGLLVRLADDSYITFNETFLILGFVVLHPIDAWTVAVGSAAFFLLRRPASWLGGLSDCVTVVVDASLGLGAVIAVRALLGETGAPPMAVLLASVLAAAIAMNFGALVSKLPYVVFVPRDVREVIAPAGFEDVVAAIGMTVAAQAPTVVLAAVASEAAWWLPAMLLAPLLHSWWAAESSARLAEARQQARTDPLTGIANRLGFVGQVEPRLGAGAVAFALGDVDDFKSINDTSGHAAGDEVLRVVAGLLRSAVGSHDIVVSRYGGEEFLAAYFGASADDMAGWADQVRAAVRNALADHRSGISIGISQWRGEDDTLEHAIERADMAMYAAKLSGKDQVRVFEEGGAAPRALEVAAPERLDRGAEAA